MDITPTNPDSPGQDDGTTGSPRGPTRIDRRTDRRLTGSACWNVEMLESPLMDHGIAYSVTDAASPEPGDDGRAWIDFELPTQRYKNAASRNQLSIRLTVSHGRLALTAPHLYPPRSLKRTEKTPVDAAGNLQIVRLGDDGDSQLDLLMAADGTVTATLRMETLRRPFNRADIVQIAQEFAVGIDLLDFVVSESDLLIEDQGD